MSWLIAREPVRISGLTTASKLGVVGRATLNRQMRVGRVFIRPSPAPHWNANLESLGAGSKLDGARKGLGCKSSTFRSLGMISPVSDQIDKTNERLKAAAELLRLKREADIRLSLALDVAGIGQWDWDIESDALVWDRRMCQLFDADETVPKTYDTFLDRVVPEDRGRVQEAVDTTLATGEPYEVYYVIAWRDGSRREVHARGLRYPNGEGLEKMIGVCMEVRADRCAGCQ